MKGEGEVTKEAVERVEEMDQAELTASSKM